MVRDRFLLVCLGVCVAAGLWGLYWIPQRQLEAAGLTGGWGTIAQYLISTVILLPFAIYYLIKRNQSGFGLIAAGTLMGGGIVCYANSLLLTEVMRTMLLFYLTPFWATLIEIVFLRQRPGWWRILSLPLAIAGAMIVIGRGQTFPMPANVGDWLALSGGAIYAAGAARIQHSKVTNVFPIIFAFFFYGSIVAIIQGMIFANQLGPAPEVARLATMVPWLLALSLFFFIPTNAIISWAPSQISTGLFSILILSELIFGTISAALWANEAFGPREIIGSGCILLAGILEVALAPRQSSQTNIRKAGIENAESGDSQR